MSSPVFHVLALALLPLATTLLPPPSAGLAWQRPCLAPSRFSTPVTLGPLSAMMSRRSRQRKRGKLAQERAEEVDVLRTTPSATVGPARGAAPARPPPFRYLCVCDVEATCDEASDFKSYSHEIIEFPVVVVDLHENAIVDEFHSYVRPTINASLTDFCTRLTGITQARVEAAPTLPQVLEDFDAWRLERGYAHNDDGADFAFAADGPWDLRYFLHGECTRKGISKRSYFDKWVNIKSLFSDFYRVRPCKIHKMLQLQGMRFEGRLHSGIDDTRNIARIAIKMKQDGAGFYLNEALPPRERAGHSTSPLSRSRLD